MDLIRKNFALFGITLFLAGIFFSPALLSISILFILVQPFLVNSPKEVFRKVFSHKVTILLLTLYLIDILGGLYSENSTKYLAILRIKLPFLLLPIGLIYSEIYSKKKLVYIFIILNLFVFITGAASFVNYLLNRQEINELILQSKQIPIVTGLNHIYFSFILAFSIITGLILSLEFIENKNLKIINLIITVCNLIFLHIISARTGLVAFYITIFILVIYWGIVERKYLWMISISVFFCLVLFLSVKYVGSLRNRYENSLKDIKTYISGGNLNYWSISMRLEAWKKSIEVFKSSPLIGVGNADVQTEIRKRFSSSGTVLMVENQKGTHNQYLNILAGSGLIGILVFIMLLLLPFINSIRHKDYILIAFLLIIAVTFCVESILERQIGASFFALFIVYLDRRLRYEQQNK